MWLAVLDGTQTYKGLQTEREWNDWLPPTSVSHKVQSGLVYSNMRAVAFTPMMRQAISLLMRPSIWDDYLGNFRDPALLYRVYHYGDELRVTVFGGQMKIGEVIDRS